MTAQHRLQGNSARAQDEGAACMTAQHSLQETSARTQHEAAAGMTAQHSLQEISARAYHARLQKTPIQPAGNHSASTV